MIEPRILKGFRDYLPESMMPRERLMETSRAVYRSFGFCPIDTPALEYRETLLGKGSEETDRQTYTFQDHGKRDVGMRFDLTVPLARFAAMYINDLGVPFKRYQLGAVWRGENTQRGRYREFMQCDFDTIGTSAVAADIETALVINELMLAIGVGGFQIKLNNRQVLNGLLEKVGLADKSREVLRSLDKLPKIGREKTSAEMVATSGASESQVEQVLRLSELSGDTDSILIELDKMLEGSEVGQAGVERLRAIVSGFSAAGADPSRLSLDVSIARGLDYYTGAVFETFLDDLPNIGSVCSGGRYDNLAQLFTKKELPGIGASLGLDRLQAALEDLGKIEKVRTPADLLVVYFDASRLSDYLRISACLRSAGIGVELYPEPKKLKQQLKYADRRGFRTALIIGESEFAENQCQLKDMNRGESQTIALEPGCESLIEAVQRLVTD
jgi:histidyl-tRNA synthetase